MEFIHECFRELLKESVNCFNRPNLKMAYNHQIRKIDKKKKQNNNRSTSYTQMKSQGKWSRKKHAFYINGLNKIGTITFICAC